MIPVFVDKFAKGWPEHHDDFGRRDLATYMPIGEALIKAHATDAHLACYSAPEINRRLATELVFGEFDDGIPMLLFLVDVDGHADITPGWWATERSKIDRLLADHPGGFVYRTRGGYRIVYALASPVTLGCTADAARWKATYLAWLDHLVAVYGIVGDPSCQDWTRLYRLPRVIRDGEPQDFEIIGDVSAIGTWNVAVTIAEPEPRKPRTPSSRTWSPGEFRIDDFMASAYPGTQYKGTLTGRRWDIECPWIHEHSSESRRETSVFAYDSGAWEFKCLHAHCANRNHDDLRRWHDPSFVPFAEREHPPRVTFMNDESDDREAPPPSDDDAPTKPRTSDRDPRPQIILTSDQPAVVGHAEQALAEMGGIYVRGRQLVRVVRDRGASGWLKRPMGAPVIVPIERDNMLELLGRAAMWISIKSNGDARQMMPPAWVASMLMARGEWKLPQLEGIADAPVLRADGTVLEATGYDTATRMIFDPGGITFPPIASSPNHAEAAAALADLLSPFSEFPFVAESDRAAAAALVLSIIGRPAIGGNVPMFSSQAPTPGSGKGLLVDVAAMIATGRRAPLMAPTDDDDETRKRLLAIAIESPVMVVIDNVEGSIGSPSLAMALTAGQIKERILGSSKNVTATLRPVWAMTGNNVALRGDLGRRVVPIDLDPRIEHPEDRVFARGDLLGYVEQSRPELVRAALTVLRAFVVAGRPAHGLPSKGSFEDWDALVRGSIIWAGGADPLGGVYRIREKADDDLANLRSLLAAWHDRFGILPRTLSEAVKDAGESGDLRDALGSFCRDGKPNTKSLGYALRKVAGRVVNGKVMEVDGTTRTGITQWRVTCR